LLFTEIQETQSDLVYPDGFRHDDALNMIRNKLTAASLYVLDEHALAMGANVALTKPSSILASLPYVALPSEATWIEFENIHARRATAALGSPNVRPENGRVEIVRSGFLMYLDQDEASGRKDIVVEYVHKDKPDFGAYRGQTTFTDIAPVIGRFSLKDTDEFRMPFFPTLPRDKSVPTKGKFRQHQDLMGTTSGSEASRPLREITDGGDERCPCRR
jgi:hypothetical protein